MMVRKVGCWLVVGWLVAWGLLLPATVLAQLAEDQVPPHTPAEAVKRFTLPEGFQATLFAGEPDVVQPIAFTFDDRGRLWVVECLSYPEWNREGGGHDRVVIFEDTDHDGKFDTRKVFLDNGVNLSGIQWGFGGVWLCSTPNLVFVPDANQDDTPDGPQEIKLDGWDITAKHNVFNALNWGPDGWLYGCNGILSNSKVGKPGTPEDQRTPINCGVWRYHPRHGTFEVVATGSTNPWGLDFDQTGQMYITNCVIKHLWHVIPGARYERMFGQEFNPHHYELIASCADHIHWGGGHWTDSRGNTPEHDSAGGGHAHSGAMIYLGDNWPKQYRNRLFTCNIHGARVNSDSFHREGSGYVAHHEADVLRLDDPWFRGLAVQYGPDGGVYMTDWSDWGECHNYVDVDRESGRIYKIKHGQPKPFKGDLKRLNNKQLVDLHQHGNEWFVRHARRLLTERAQAGNNVDDAVNQLKQTLSSDSVSAINRTRLLWTLQSLESASVEILTGLLADESEDIRALAVRLLMENGKLESAALNQLAELATKEPSGLVRLYLASGLQRLPLADRWEIALGLVGHDDEQTDRQLALMIWYGIEPLVPTDTDRTLKLANASQIPLLREFIARRLAATDMNTVAEVLKRAETDTVRLDLLRGLHESLRGRRDVAMPSSWQETAQALLARDHAELRERTLALSVIFGDAAARATLRELVQDPAVALEQRDRAVQNLVQAKDAELVAVLKQLLNEPAMAGTSLRAMAAFADEDAPALIVQHYNQLDDAARQDAISTLSSRPSYALALLAAVEAGEIPRAELSAFNLRQLQGLKDQAVNDKLASVWGAIRDASAERTALIAELKEKLTPEVLKEANHHEGRATFKRLCATCHTLFDDGGKIGPELTGAQRNNLDYVLSNVLDPSAVVARDYQVTLIQTADGRVISGIIKKEDPNGLTIQAANELVIVPHTEIEAREQTASSMMPDGLIAKLSPQEVRNLIAYLASPSQVALPPEAAGAEPKDAEPAAGGQ